MNYAVIRIKCTEVLIASATGSLDYPVHSSGQLFLVENNVFLIL